MSLTKNTSFQDQIPGSQLVKPFFNAVARKAITEFSPDKRSLATAVGSVKANVLVTTFIEIFFIALKRFINKLFVNH